MLDELAKPELDTMTCMITLEHVSNLLAAHEKLPAALTRRIVPSLLAMLDERQDTMVLALAIKNCARLVASGAVAGGDFVARLDGLKVVCSRAKPSARLAHLNAYP